MEQRRISRRQALAFSAWAGVVSILPGCSRRKRDYSKTIIIEVEAKISTVLSAVLTKSDGRLTIKAIINGKERPIYPDLSSEQISDLKNGAKLVIEDLDKKQFEVTCTISK